ncbi:hypothetical protein [Erythrobacter sp. F6033]|uniref:hypothetical protein n=1 Tax=Erythrobacter sp. F6033 TaxID=2926401 RepID=UPI001FF129DE|nr:hypothetical protein [Erythrobacter sp. F6033]MCK0129747.1 hypothetical protein [Erythrobacter sp. F6033]
MEDTENSMVVLAIFVSRFEAIAVASMLRAYGVHVSLDGEWHASIEFNSMTLGGHRLRVMRRDYGDACEIIRQTQLAERDYASSKPNSALLAMVGFVGAAFASFFVPAVLLGAMPAWTLVYVPYSVYSIPVDPKGKADYFLTKLAE